MQRSDIFIFAIALSTSVCSETGGQSLREPKPDCVCLDSYDTVTPILRPPGETDVDFWIGLELGVGAASPVCATCGENGPQGGSTGNVYLGFGLSRDFLLGVQGSFWINDAGVYNQRPDKIYRTQFLLVSYYYPWTRSGVFAKLGIGFSAYNAYDRYLPHQKDINGFDRPSQVHADGPGASVGLGNEFTIAGKVSLVLSLIYTYAKLGALTLNETRDIAGGKSLHLLELNVGFLFRTTGR